MTTPHANKSDGPAATPITGFTQAQKQAKSIFAAQRELLDSLEQMNEHWLARAKSEAELATALASRLASIRSVPDATNVYQDWLGRRMQRYVDDTNHVLLDVQKLMQTGARLVQNGRSVAP